MKGFNGRLFRFMKQRVKTMNRLYKEQGLGTSEAINQALRTGLMGNLFRAFTGKQLLTLNKLLIGGL